MIGVLLYDDVINRFVVDPLTMATDATTVELHCGNCLSVRTKDGQWQKTRIETNSDSWFDWYFTGLDKTAKFIGHYAMVEG